MIEKIGRRLRSRRADPAKSPLAAKGFDAPQDVSISSPEFVDGAPMPVSSAARPVGDNRSPELRWDGVPSQTIQLALIMDDIDVPLRTPIVHCAALLNPSAGGLAAGAFQAGQPGIRVLSSMGRSGYQGPRPIPGHGPHRYRFHLLALDVEIPESVTSVKALFAVASGHVLARGLLIGTYER